MTTVEAFLFDAATREEDIASWVASCPRTGAGRASLVSLLPEQHPLYGGRSTSETARIRGYTLAAFERVGLPQDALPYVLDELQNGDDAYLVAAAAKALRGAAAPADVGFATPFLEAARKNILYADAPVTFDVYKPHYPVSGCTTATREIDGTLRWIGNVEGGAVPAWSQSARRRIALPHVELEDQDGRRIAFAEFFSGKPCAVAFFYSRCDNVRKCSLTVTKLAALQRELVRRGLDGRVRLSAITYDPRFDLPARLKSYGRERGVVFGDDVAFFRVPEGFDDVRGAFELGVNFVGALVNRHRIELYVVDARGRLAASFTRFSWSESAVADHLEDLVRGSWRPDAARTTTAGVASVIVALLPKCPLCLGAYPAALGAGGLLLAPYRSWLLPAALILLVIHIITMGRRRSRPRRLAPLAVSVAGAVALIAGSVVWLMPAVSFTGAILMTIGPLLLDRR